MLPGSDSVGLLLTGWVTTTVKLAGAASAECDRTRADRRDRGIGRGHTKRRDGAAGEVAAWLAVGTEWDYVDDDGSVCSSQRKCFTGRVSAGVEVVVQRV